MEFTDPSICLLHIHNSGEICVQICMFGNLLRSFAISCACGIYKSCNLPSTHSQFRGNLCANLQVWQSVEVICNFVCMWKLQNPAICLLHIHNSGEICVQICKFENLLRSLAIWCACGISEAVHDFGFGGCKLLMWGDLCWW